MSRSSAAFNPTLTNYAQGLSQDKASAIAEFLAPTVQVSAIQGHYKKFSDKNSFFIPSTARALGGPATRLAWSATDGDYNCEPQALEAPIDDAERDAAGDQEGIIEEGKTRDLVNTAILAREKNVITIAKAGVAAIAGKGNWTAGANDPVQELDAAIEAISIATGIMPNRMIMGLGAWRIARSHPEVIKRFPGAALIGVTAAQFAALLLNPSIDIRIAVLSQDTSAPGKTATKANIMGDEVFTFIGSATPSLYDASALKTFAGGRYKISAVRVYRAESNRSDILAVDWSEDVQVISTDCIRRHTIT
ncbi:MAG: hypothetical protein HY343_08665 [Lentisphaerae bacterium]|nr:hypothetical protein [Lentisphaerota bacterium]